MRILPTTAVLALLLLAGCSGDGPDSSTASSSTTTSSSTTAAPPACLAENALQDRLDVLRFASGTLEVRSTVAGKNTTNVYAADPAREAFSWAYQNGTDFVYGNEFYSVNATGNATRHRDLADPAFSQRLHDYALGGLADSDASSFFGTPSHLFAATCVQEAGKTVHVLLRESGGIRERWRFGDNGTFLEATFTESASETSGSVKYSAKPALPDVPVASKPEAFLRYVEIVVGDTHALRIQPISPGSRYSDLRFRFLATDGSVAQSVPMPTRSETAAGTIEVVDLGKAGIVDDGDVWFVTYGEASQFRVYDNWSRTNVTLLQDYLADEAIPPVIDEDPNVVEKSYSWTHAGTARKVTASIPDALLRRDEARIIPRNALGPAYDLLIHDARTATVVGQVADQLLEVADAEGMTDPELAALALSFVQSLKDGFPASRPDDRFLRSPAMTLAADGGDSEDNAVLLASLLDALGQDVILLRGDRHTSVGVALNGTSPGGTVSLQNVRYWQAEPTPGGPALGLPDPKRPRPEPVDVSSRTKLTLDLDPVEDENGVQHLSVEVANTGRRDTLRGELLAFMQADETGETAMARDTCAFPPLLPGATFRCDLWLPTGPTIVVRLGTAEGLN
ncbi:MAG: hypothetical protein QOD77_1344 [Thermoplasmata archaeon]|nr:hypothetical protein [Thermoplasmata archaeon]